MNFAPIQLVGSALTGTMARPESGRLDEWTDEFVGNSNYVGRSFESGPLQINHRN